MQFIQNQDPVDANATGTHEEFWVFSQVSQWGSNWIYSNHEYLYQIRQIVNRVRSMGIKNKYPARMVHYAQMLIWRYYLKVHDEEFSTGTIDAAFESAAQLLEMHSSRDPQMHQNQDQSRKTSELRQQFKLDFSLDFNIRIKHPSEYLSRFVTSQFGEKQFQLAECIISDSYLSPCCLLHTPLTIAEGAAVMAAGMTNMPAAAIPQTTKSLSFIKDMKFFYRHQNLV